VKIAFVVPGGVDRGGTHRVIPVLLAQVERVARVHELHVFALHQEPEPTTYPLLGATVHCVGAGRGATRRAVAAILREHRRAPFRLLQAVFGGSAAAAAAAGVVARIPYTVHLAGGELTDLPGIGYGGWRRSRTRWLMRAALWRADRITVASGYMQARAAELGIPVQRLTWGVDLEAFPPADPRPRAAGPARLLFVGSLNRVKDPLTAIRAAALLKDRGADFRLSLVGEDLLGGAAQREIRALGLDDRVELTGFVTHAELHSVLVEADVLLLPSLHDADPQVLHEAAVCGVPAVGTAVGQLPEWAPDAGVVVPAGDPAGMAAAVVGLLGDEERRLRLAAEAQRRAVAMNADRTAELLLELYQEVAGE